MNEEKKVYNAGYYRGMHENNQGYQQNNWLLPYENFLFSTKQISTVLELGCGNGKFLKVAKNHAEIVKGIDWHGCRYDLPPGVVYLDADFTKREFSNEYYSLICSADVFEHLPERLLPGLIGKISRAAQFNFHVMACYDDGHSHLSVFDAEKWLSIFRGVDRSYYIYQSDSRNRNGSKPFVAITN